MPKLFVNIRYKDGTSVDILDVNAVVYFDSGTIHVHPNHKETMFVKVSEIVSLMAVPS